MKISKFIIVITILSLSMYVISFGQTNYTTDLGTIQSSYTYGTQPVKKSSNYINYIDVVNKVSTPSFITNSYVSTAAEEFIKQTKSYNQYSGLFIGFDGIKVAKLHPISEDLLESWQTKNYAIYSTDAQFKIFSYEEYSQDKKLIKSYVHTIIIHFEDDEVHTLVVRNADDNTVYRVLMWKDGSMIALEAGSGIYLITGEYKILRF